MLKFIYDTEADIPAHAKGEYKQNGEGKWELDVQGAVSASFRDKNIELQRWQDTVKGQVKPLIEAGLLDEQLVPKAESITEYKGLKEIKGKLDESKLIKNDKVDELITQRTQAMKDEHAREKQALEAAVKQRDEELAVLKIDNRIIAEVTRHGAEPWAVEDLVRRGRERFVLEEGKVVAYKTVDGKREKDYTSKKGGLLTIEEWAEELPTAAPGYFKKSEGAGGQGSGGDQKGHALLKGRGNPWLKNTPHHNLTLQGEIEKKDPALAKRLKAEAGAK
jgi:hypothetical protein